MSVMKISFYTDGPLLVRSKDSDINWMLIDFINEKKRAAKLTNKEISKLYVTKNPYKLERALDDFDRTGYLNPNYLKWLGGILDFTQEDIKEVEKKFNSFFYEDRSVFIENFQLIRKYSELIISRQDFSNITFNGLGICGGIVNRHRPLTLGELFTHYSQGHLISDKSCCGRVYIFCAGGSVLSGSHQFTGFCSKCNSLVYDSFSSYQIILSPFFNYNPEEDYIPSPLGIKNLVEELKILDQKTT